MSEEDKGIIRGMHLAGTSIRNIARQVGRSSSCIQGFLTRVAQQAEMPRVERRGGKRKSTALVDRDIVIAAKRNRFISAPEIQRTVPGADRLSHSTILSRIKETGELKSYWAVKKPFISENNRANRLQWARDHLNWTVEQWRSVLWSDESPFVLRNQGRKRVWRMHNERYDARTTQGTVKHSAKIQVWGCFSSTGVGQFVNIEGILNQISYRNILQTHMLPSKAQLFGNGPFIFQQDNDPKHTAHSVRDWFEEHHVNVLPWPSQSPDLNPIENLWSILDHRVRNRTPNTKEELLQGLRLAWEAIPQETLQSLVDSMPDRCRAVIAARGGNTKY